MDRFFCDQKNKRANDLTQPNPKFGDANLGVSRCNEAKCTLRTFDCRFKQFPVIDGKTLGAIYASIFRMSQLSLRRIQE